jgi:hypothetical protein
MKTMRNGLYAALAIAALVLVVGNPASMQAQSPTMSVRIPFEFHVGHERLPAGTYTVDKRGDAISLRGGKGSSAFVLTNSLGVSSPEGGLVFHRYLDSYFLAEAQWGGLATSGRLIPSPKEIALAGTISPQPVRIAANSR